MPSKNPRFSGSLRPVYDLLGLDGRTRKGKYLAQRWRTLFPRVRGDSVKESLLLRLLKFESDYPKMTGHDIGILMQMYNKLGLMPDAPDTTPSTNPLADYLEKNP